MYVEMSGQWRIGFGGRYALDYTPLMMRMERLHLPDDEWEEAFAYVRVIERTMLMPESSTVADVLAQVTGGRA